MAEKTEPTDETAETPEVEAHSSVLDSQGLGQGMDKSNTWLCLSSISSANDV